MKKDHTLQSPYISTHCLLDLTWLEKKLEMIYDCDRCGYTTNKRSDFLRHLSRKEPCIATLNNVSVKEIKKKYQLIEPASEADPETHPFECLYCNRRYKYKYNKTKHLKTCAIRKETELIQSQMTSHRTSQRASSYVEANQINQMNQIKQQSLSLDPEVMFSMLTEIINAVNALERKITIPYNITMYSGKECECCERNKTFSNSASLAEMPG